jgi:hypothetical protein
MARTASSSWTTFAILLVVLVAAGALLYYCMPGKAPAAEEYVNHDDSMYETYANADDDEDEAAMAPAADGASLYGSNGDSVVKPAEDTEDGADANESAQTLGSDDGSASASLPKDCFPKDQLTPQELLPADANSTWAQVVPAGQGSVGDQNFLNAGFHVGINTVGQTLRNANLQLRSEPPNPQVKVSPWLQSTIEPDTNRKPMEIGGQ